jgi:CRISPR-associated protein Cmr4
VRTSVSIDPETGAASDKALFTYEAIPRAAILWLEVVEDDFGRKFPNDHDKAKELGHTRPLDVVTAGLKLTEMLGVGGMGTRGFGRVRMLNGENAQ